MYTYKLSICTHTKDIDKEKKRESDIVNERGKVGKMVGSLSLVRGDECVS